MTGKIEGIDGVTRRLTEKLGDIESLSLEGLYRGGLLIQRTSQQLTPRDTGNLRGSAYTRKDSAGKKSVEIGYTALYAPFVHENMEQTLKGQPRRGGSGKGVYWETGQPKFLESALHKHEKDVIRLATSEARKATR